MKREIFSILFALVLVLSFSAIGGSAQAQGEPSSDTPGAWRIYPDSTPDHWVGNDRYSQVHGSNLHTSIHEALGYSGQLLYPGPDNDDIGYWEFYNPPPEGTIIELRGGTSDTGAVWEIGGDGAQGGVGREKMKSLVVQQKGITIRGQDYDAGTGKMVQQEVFFNNGGTTALFYLEASDLTIENLHISGTWPSNSGGYALSIGRYTMFGPDPKATGLTVTGNKFTNLRAMFDTSSPSGHPCWSIPVPLTDATITNNFVDSSYYNLFKKHGVSPEGNNLICGNTFNRVGEGKSYPMLDIVGHTGTTCIDYNTFNGWASGQYAIKVKVDISAHPINLGENNIFVDQVGGSGAVYESYPLTSGGHAVGATSEDDIIKGCGPSLVPMSEFTIDHAKLDFKKKADDDKVDVKGTLALDTNGEVDISEDVTVTVGTLSQTITMVEKGKKGDKWEYKCPKDGIGNIKYMKIDWKNGKFDFRMDKVDLTGVTNPVTISIQIGDDVGSESILMTEKKHHWDYKAPKPPK